MDRTPPSGESTDQSRAGAQQTPVILVADDSRVVTELLRRWLQQFGATVLVAADGDTALRLGLEQHFDLAVVDQVMPGRVGAEIVQAWRNAGILAPVIMISAMEDRRMRSDALELGADSYLYKPVTREELLAEVERLLAGEVEAAE